MTCKTCGAAAHIDFQDRSTRCQPCHRVASYCNCEPVKAERMPLWLQLAREKRNGLARDLTGVA